MRAPARILVPIPLCLSALVLLSCSRTPGGGNDTGGTRGREAIVTFAAGLDSVAPGTAAERVGKRIYTRYCQVCHGEEGAGDGFNAYNLRSSLGIIPTNFTDSTFVTTSTDSSIVSAIREGGRGGEASGCLLPWGETLSPLELMDVGGYVHTLVAATAAEE